MDFVNKYPKSIHFGNASRIFFIYYYYYRNMSCGLKAQMYTSHFSISISSKLILLKLKTKYSAWLIKSYELRVHNKHIQLEGSKTFYPYI